MVGGGETYMMNGFDDDDNIMFEEDVFGKIEDLLDFSTVDMELLLEPEHMMNAYDDSTTNIGNSDGFDDFPPVPNSIVAGSVGSGEVKEDDGAFKCGDIDAAELEWVANVEEGSLSPVTVEVFPKNNDVVISSGMDGIGSDGNNSTDILHYRTPSPVSVLEHNGRLIIGGGLGTLGGGSFSSSSSSPTSSSSCSSISTRIKLLAPASPPEAVLTRGRAPRTKRPRTPSIPRSCIPLPVTPSSYDDVLIIPSANYDTEHFSESSLIITGEFQEDPLPAAAFVDDGHHQKKKRIKIVSSLSNRSYEENQPNPVQKCMHCEITKTPQWRAGPMGPKTLCNACGVRYKSGRLFPEYRPAASPTFVVSQHSNSHKKVVEMRVKSTQKVSVPITPSLPVSAKGCELLNYIKSN